MTLFVSLFCCTTFDTGCHLLDFVGFMDYRTFLTPLFFYLVRFTHTKSKLHYHNPPE